MQKWVYFDICALGRSHYVSIERCADRCCSKQSLTTLYLRTLRMESETISKRRFLINIETNSILYQSLFRVVLQDKIKTVVYFS